MHILSIWLGYTGVCADHDAMIRFSFGRYIAYLLIVLLPLQVAAVGRSAMCTETSQSTVHEMDPGMEQCDQATPMSPTLPDDSPIPLHKDSSCWLGSVCLVHAMVFAVSLPHQLSSRLHDELAYPVVIAHYRSVVLDGPQRPPAIFQ